MRKNRSNRFNLRPASQRYLKHWQDWAGAFAGVRSRLLIWYFLLTLCLTLISVWATFKIFCELEQHQAGQRLQRDMSVLGPQLVQATRAQPSPTVLVDTLEQFTQRQVSDPSESLVLVLDDQLYVAPSSLLPPALRQNPEVIRQWAQARSLRSTVQEDYIIRVVQPLQVLGKSATFVGLYDATLRFKMGETTLAIVVQVTIALMVLFMAIAWLIAGRLLAPLRQLSDTAQAITATDLSQRIPVRGTDEIAELTLTVNQMLNRLEAAFTSQQDFIKDVSHELRTPITIIQGHLELLGDDPAERQATVALVRDELRRMNQFVNDLLLLMRAERPNFLRPSGVDLESLTQELFAKAQGLAARNWKLEAVGQGDVVCDRQRITQVILNLAQNATQYTHYGDTIALGSARVNGTVQFWVRDTGEGISLDDQARIFDRFARGAGSERRSDGAGLGLSIVQALVKAHGGMVELFSRLGDGTTFTVILPQPRTEVHPAAHSLPLIRQPIVPEIPG
jgi:signal transduction histidine kinase